MFDEIFVEIDWINVDICEIFDIIMIEWGVEVMFVELKDI